MGNKGLLLATLLFGAACSQIQPVNSAGITTALSSGTSTTNVRECTGPDNTIMQGSLSRAQFIANLQTFMEYPVQNLVADPGYCLDLIDLGNNNYYSTASLSGDTNVLQVGGTLRIEYEDDVGVRYYQSTASEVLYGAYMLDTNAIDIIIDDGAGLIEVKSTGGPTSGNLTGVINFYNFPSYQDALQSELTDAAAYCQQDPAACFGVIPPTSPAFSNLTVAESPYQQELQQAQSILNNTSETKSLGTINFTVSQILPAQ